MPGKCLSAQTEGDKCCWRGHDKLATVNLRTRSPTGGPGVDTIPHDCWMCLTALMKRINKKWEAPPPPPPPLPPHTPNFNRPCLSTVSSLMFPCFSSTVGFGFDQGLIFCDISDTYYESNTSPHREAGCLETLTVAERYAEQGNDRSTSHLCILSVKKKKINPYLRSHTSV